MRTHIRAQHNAYGGFFGHGASTSLERGGGEEIVLASFAPGAVVAEVARQFDVSTSLIYKWRRNAQQSEAMFVPAIMAEDEGPLVPAVSGDGRADSPATASARLVLAVLQALR